MSTFSCTWSLALSQWSREVMFCACCSTATVGFSSLLYMIGSIYSNMAKCLFYPFINTLPLVLRPKSLEEIWYHNGLPNMGQCGLSSKNWHHMTLMVSKPHALYILWDLHLQLHICQQEDGGQWLTTIMENAPWSCANSMHVITLLVT